METEVFEKMQMYKRSCVKKSVTGKSTVYHMDVKTGDGTMTKVEVLPGVELFICSFNTTDFISSENVNDNYEINFCISGSYEFRYSPRDYVELFPGDMTLSNFSGKKIGQFQSLFPMGSYEGVAIILNPNIAEEWLRKNVPAFHIDIAEIMDALLCGKWFLVKKATMNSSHIFKELYAGYKTFDEEYLQLKVIELFMELKRMRVEETGYLQNKELEQIRVIRDFIISNYNKHMTIENIAEKFGISTSHLRRIFEEEYKMPIYSYLKKYRMEQASHFLLHSGKSITEIALEVGYANPGKFSGSFKDYIGMSPKDFRKKKQQNENFSSL